MADHSAWDAELVNTIGTVVGQEPSSLKGDAAVPEVSFQRTVGKSDVGNQPEPLELASRFAGSGPSAPSCPA